jgi:hypothetical protein
MSLVGSLPYTLTNGTTADANQVQANLQYIADQVNANVAAAITAAVLTALPVGTIAEWSGSVASIPAPWQLCDGTNGTPDLRDKFVVGAGGAYAVGAVGGAASNTPTITVAGHTLTVPELPAHSHGVSDPTHSHGVSDPTHSHGVSDPTHAHTAQTGPGAVIYEAGGAFTNNTLNLFGAASPIAIDNASTGISVDSASTGVSVDGSATGISIQNTGSNSAHTHGASSTAVPTLPPYYALAKIRKMS